MCHGCILGVKSPLPSTAHVSGGGARKISAVAPRIYAHLSQHTGKKKPMGPQHDTRDTYHPARSTKNEVRHAWYVLRVMDISDLRFTNYFSQPRNLATLHKLGRKPVCQRLPSQAKPATYPQHATPAQLGRDPTLEWEQPPGVGTWARDPRLHETLKRACLSLRIFSPNTLDSPGSKSLPRLPRRAGRFLKRFNLS